MRLFVSYFSHECYQHPHFFVSQPSTALMQPVPCAAASLESATSSVRSYAYSQAVLPMEIQDECQFEMAFAWRRIEVLRMVPLQSGPGLAHVSPSTASYPNLNLLLGPPQILLRLLQMRRTTQHLALHAKLPPHHRLPIVHRRDGRGAHDERGHWTPCEGMEGAGWWREGGPDMFVDDAAGAMGELYGLTLGS
ncbi:hypothetical protein SVAN01_04941 [Stagonosporopsis vannaccii]|nr:hypothetical protein SVAN01_04941 [Stagonosporopsis vannaccii]